MRRRYIVFAIGGNWKMSRVYSFEITAESLNDAINKARHMCKLRGLMFHSVLELGDGR